MDINKSSGLILHPTSLPSSYGIGDLGKESYEFIDLLNQSETEIWQVLPLGITDNIEFSPYSSKSSVLGNPYIVSLDNLENSIYNESELNEIKLPITNEVNYKAVYTNKDKIFNLISERVNYNDNEYQNFLENDLIKRHITFITLSEVFESSWSEWSSDYQNFSEELYDCLLYTSPSPRD